jgi:hypothetical protein
MARKEISVIFEHPRYVRYEADTSCRGLSNARKRLIERRAYHKWENRGHRFDSAVQDWLEAEAEIDEELRTNGYLHFYASPIPCELAPR